MAAGDDSGQKMRKDKSLSKLLAERKSAQERAEKAKADLAAVGQKIAAIKKSNETSMGMAYWRWKMKHRGEEYEQDLASEDFDRYIVSPMLRILFGLGEKTGTAEPMTQKNITIGTTGTGTGEGESGEKRVYLSVSYAEREAAKKIAIQIYGKDTYRQHLDFDKAARKWFLRGETDPAPFAAWIPTTPAPDGSGGGA